MSNIVRIHHLVELDIDPAFPWRDRWLELIEDVIALSASDEPAQARLILRYVEKLSNDGMRKLADHLYMQPGVLLDTQYGVQLSRDEDDHLVITTDNPCLEWMTWGIQLVLLEQGCTFVHAAAMERDGRAVLFPSWGRVGKTMFISRMVQDMDWRYLSDDLVILAPDGTCYGYPRMVLIYPHHRSALPEVFDKGTAIRTPSVMNDLFFRFAVVVKEVLRPFPRLFDFARQHNPQAVRVQPSEIFGREKLALKSHVQQVIWLERVTGQTEAESFPADETFVSRVMGSTLAGAFYPHCIQTSQFAIGLGILNVDHVFQNWSQTLTSAFDTCDKRMLYLPEDGDVDVMVASISKELEESPTA